MNEMVFVWISAFGAIVTLTGMPGIIILVMDRSVENAQAKAVRELRVEMRPARRFGIRRFPLGGR